MRVADDTLGVRLSVRPDEAPSPTEMLERLSPATSRPFIAAVGRSRIAAPHARGPNAGPIAAGGNEGHPCRTLVHDLTIAPLTSSAGERLACDARQAARCLAPINDQDAGGPSDERSTNRQ